MGIDKKGLEKDIETWITTYAKAYCHKASEEITRMAKDAIYLFYEQYQPLYYNRTDDLKSRSYSPYYHNNGRIIYGGVIISAEKMQPYKNSGITKEEITMSAWERGIHGFKNHNPSNKIHTYPPIAMVEMAMYNKKFLKDLDKYATHIANNQKYTCLKL